LFWVRLSCEFLMDVIPFAQAIKDMLLRMVDDGFLRNNTAARGCLGERPMFLRNNTAARGYLGERPMFLWNNSAARGVVWAN
jgi:hypothetical protein